MTDRIDYELLNEQVEKAVTRRKKFSRWVFFGVHVFMFILFTVLMWMMASTSPELQQLADGEALSGILIMATMGWLTGLSFHGIATLFDSGLMDHQMRKEVVSKELGTMLLDQAVRGQQEKSKRRLEDDDEEEEVMLSEDGELVPVKRRSSQ